jgi:transporter family protein
MPWWVYALISAVAAAGTALFAKVGVEAVPSNVATAVRTAIVLAFTLGIVFVRGEQRTVFDVAPRSWAFLGLSGILTGVSWLAYFRALQLAPASKVAPIDKLSLALTIVLAGLVLGEHISPRLAAGVVLIVAGTLLTLAS